MSRSYYSETKSPRQVREERDFHETYFKLNNNLDLLKQEVDRNCSLRKTLGYRPKNFRVERSPLRSTISRPSFSKTAERGSRKTAADTYEWQTQTAQRYFAEKERDVFPRRNKYERNERSSSPYYEPYHNSYDYLASVRKDLRDFPRPAISRPSTFVPYKIEDSQCRKLRAAEAARISYNSPLRNKVHFEPYEPYLSSSAKRVSAIPKSSAQYGHTHLDEEIRSLKRQVRNLASSNNYKTNFMRNNIVRMTLASKRDQDYSTRVLLKSRRASRQRHSRQASRTSSTGRLSYSPNRRMEYLPEENINISQSAIQRATFNSTNFSQRNPVFETNYGTLGGNSAYYPEKINSLGKVRPDVFSQKMDCKYSGTNLESSLLDSGAFRKTQEVREPRVLTPAEKESQREFAETRLAVDNLLDRCKNKKNFLRSKLDCVERKLNQIDATAHQELTRGIRNMGSSEDDVLVSPKGFPTGDLTAGVSAPVLSTVSPAQEYSRLKQVKQQRVKDNHGLNLIRKKLEGQHREVENQKIDQLSNSGQLHKVPKMYSKSTRNTYSGEEYSSGSSVYPLTLPGQAWRVYNSELIHENIGLKNKIRQAQRALH